ncbi:hypothetical protein CTRI78_v006748 [Colletotrichum trifolii]|uniref:Uncharacterized protein n=1 Tax=Colletotrichum trifolii TaxID=5466 RepID=A0A4R8RBM4_COLTR|nr:hypothetical protein CTRI78_v006748 [Colletotrichum trifolii]
MTNQTTYTQRSPSQTTRSSITPTWRYSSRPPRSGAPIRNKFWFHRDGNLYSLLVVLELLGRNSNWTRLSDPGPAIARLSGAPEDPVTESADATRAKLIKLDAELEAMDEAGGGGIDGTEQEQAFANMQSQYCLAYCKERVLPKLVDCKYLEDALEECEENESTREMIKSHRKTPFWVNDAAGRIRLVCFSPLKSEQGGFRLGTALIGLGSCQLFSV